jgi:putative protease
MGKGAEDTAGPLPAHPGLRALRYTVAVTHRTLHRPEVLAPAGDMDALRAAVAAGADAVYFGLSRFNARARATNFDRAGLDEAIGYLHRHGVKGYVTLNTLVFDSELGAMEESLRACAEAGVDAVIVQDLAVAQMARALVPDLPVHASTQMTCTDADAVEFARGLGARRVILARELSLDDIAAIRRDTDAELEVFVHGALCIAYSGQCLTSEAIGGRSANRGACAQACRLPYSLVVDGALRDTGDRAFLLSPEDLEASDHVAALAALGVSSIKIEGRLKGPAYVAASTRLYRAAVDGAEAADREAPRAAALQMFSRGSGEGFFAGVDHQRLVDGRTCDHRGVVAGEVLGTGTAQGKTWVRVRAAVALARGDGVLVEGGRGGEGELGGRVWLLRVDGKDVASAAIGDAVELWLGPERPVQTVVPGRRLFRTHDPAAERAVEDTTARQPYREAVDITVSGAVGELPRFEARSARGRRAAVTGDAPVLAAQGRATDEAALRDKLGRLGDTPFALGAVDNQLGEGAMIAPAALNRARRALAAALLADAPGPWSTTLTTASELLAAATPPDRAPPPGGLFVLCRTLPQAHAALDAGADGVVLDFLELTGTGAAVRALRERSGSVHITLAPPRIRKPGEEKIDRYLLGLGPDALLVRSLGALRQAASGGPPRIGDASLNVTNRLTAATVLGAGLAAFTPGFDLDAAQVTALVEGPFGPWAELVVHHPMALFHMEHCVIARELSSGSTHKDCGRPCERHQVSLRDRAGMDHPVEADVGCRNTVFHAAPQSAAGIVPAAQAAGVGRFRVELVRESPEEVGRVVEAYRALLSGSATPEAVWRTLRAEGHYGVVRGSLRVLTA